MPPMLVVKCLGIMRKEVLVFPNTLSSKKKKFSSSTPLLSTLWV